MSLTTKSRNSDITDNHHDFMELCIDRIALGLPYCWALRLPGVGSPSLFAMRRAVMVASLLHFP
jgi:hypothetical protein